MMRIYIPTRGRIDYQLTYNNLPDALKSRTTIVCPENEVDWHKKKRPLAGIIAQPNHIVGISEKRKWIVDQCPYSKMVMLDDDLRFAVRRDDDPSLFRPAVLDDIIKAFGELEDVLSPDCPHAGFSARGGWIGASAQRGGWQAGKRMMYVLGYYTFTVREHAIFGRLKTHEDMDVCLQLLTKGFTNKVNHSFVVDQKFGSPGGCTNERTIEQSNADSYQLAAWFPNYVRTSEKEYKASVPRVEVVCQWAKALKDGLVNRQ